MLLKRALAAAAAAAPLTPAAAGADGDHIRPTPPSEPPGYPAPDSSGHAPQPPPVIGPSHHFDS
jgi:hypothetical protein